MTREQRTVFGEVAELYDRARPSYPDELFDSVVTYAELSPGDLALEIGAGTGKATEKFVARGLDVLALEPSAGMAAVLRDKGVRVEESTFEDWSVSSSPFSLVYAAQSWHWVIADVRYGKAFDALAPGGTLALFWNKPYQFTGAFLHDIDAVFVEHAPGLRAGMEAFEDVMKTSGQLVAHGGFVDVTSHLFHWSHTLSTAEYVANQRTQSTHRMLPEEQRTRLHDGIAGVIDAHGGVVEVAYDTLLFMARRG